MVDNITPNPDPVITAPVAAALAVDNSPATVVTPVVEAAVEAPVVAPVVEATPVAPVVETPVTEAVKPPEKAPETVLGDALDKKPITPEVKPVEGTPEVVEIKPEGQSDEPAPPPSYEPFKLPEDVKLEPERLGNLTKLLGELELSGKVEHTSMQEFGQKLLDTHIDEVKKNLSEYQKMIETSWENQKVSWKDSFLKDPEIGGNRFQTTVDSALTFIRTHGGTPEQQVEFRNLMEASGLGNHPAMIRLLANAGHAMSEGRPLAAQTPVSAPKSKISTMYGVKS